MFEGFRFKSVNAVLDVPYRMAVQQWLLTACIAIKLVSFVKTR
jgi:hypothetical protein